LEHPANVDTSQVDAPSRGQTSDDMSYCIVGLNLTSSSDVVSGVTIGGQGRGGPPWMTTSKGDTLMKVNNFWLNFTNGTGERITWSWKAGIGLPHRG